MKHKHLAGLAAFLVGTMGGAAFGDHHGGGPIVGPQENCSNYPWWCWGQCAELNACRSGNTPIGGSNCAIEEANLRSCETSQPPYVPPVIIVPACPAGQHFSEGECQADHECGDDEIGGGSEECTKCGPNKVPNEDGTECVDCDHGEFEAGECASLCSNAELDSAAALSLGGIPREPWERLESYTCDSAGHMHIKWLGSSQNAREVCRIQITNAPKASSAYGHSHPFFVWDRDKGIVCDGTPFRTEKEIDDWNKDDGDGAKFSRGDKINAEAVGKPMYLVVPKRDKVKVYRKTGRTGFWGGDIWDVEIVQ